MKVSWIYSSLINEVDMFMQEKIKLVIELYECFWIPYTHYISHVSIILEEYYYVNTLETCNMKITFEIKT